MEKNNLINYDFEKEVSLSIKEIKALKNEKAYKTYLPGYPIHESLATVCKNEKGEFEIKFIVEKPYPIDDIEMIGVKEKITLSNLRETTYVNANSITNISIRLTFPQIIKITVNNFQQKENEDYNNKILRLIIPIEINPSFEVFNAKSVKISDTVQVCGLLEIKINDKKHHLFKYKNEDTNEKFIIIDSIENNDFNDFKTNSSSILLAFGFITGNLFQDEYYYQIINHDNKLSIPEATAYYKKESSIITGADLFNPTGFQAYVKHLEEKKIFLKMSHKLDPNVFSNICKSIVEDVTFARSVKFIIEGNKTQLDLLRAGIYSIALETVTGLISKEYEDKLKPISNKKISKSIIHEFNNTLLKYEKDLSDYGIKILKAKINNINSPTNSKKLSKPFELLRIDLTESEKSVLNTRNKFLHGTSPFEENELKNKEKDIQYIAKKLLTLCNSLILKHCGYSGHLIDYGGQHQHKYGDKITEDLYKLL